MVTTQDETQDCCDTPDAPLCPWELGEASDCGAEIHCSAGHCGDVPRCACDDMDHTSEDHAASLEVSLEDFLKSDFQWVVL